VGHIPIKKRKVADSAVTSPDADSAKCATQLSSKSDIQEELITATHAPVKMPIRPKEV
jgi:phosphoribosylpyrophosphate synthetase